MSTEIKDTNPKDAIGCGKLPLDLVPQTGIAYEALAFLEGGLKYGCGNFRPMGVRASIYFAACQRHLTKYWNGEWADPKTKVPHLGSARACLNIILDSMVMGNLVDDRPPANPGLVTLIDMMSGTVAHLKEIFKDCNPHHWTINDKK